VSAEAPGNFGWTGGRGGALNFFSGGGGGAIRYRLTAEFGG